MEVTLVLGDDLISTLLKRTGVKTVEDLIKEGLGLVDWTTTEASRNRAILSIGEHGEDPMRCNTPLFQQTLRKFHPESGLLNNPE